MSDVLILGTVPPPIGGVTTHIYRLIDALSRKKIRFRFIELRKKGKINGYLSCLKTRRKEKTTTVHYQLNNWFECWLLYVMTRNKKNIFYSTVHSFRPEIMSACEKIFFLLCKITTDIILIAPSNSISEKLVKCGYKSNRIIIHNTYIDPTEKERESSIPEDIESFIRISKANNGFIVLGNAYKLYQDKNYEDVYGLDLCLKACVKIKDLYLIFCIPEYDLGYYEQCKNFINQNKINNRVLLYTGICSLIPILTKIDLFVRPSITDSFGISVAEAIACKKPALASDVCERAEGTILFQRRNLDDFCEKIMQIKNHPQNQPEIDEIDTIDFYIKLYNN